MATMTFVQMLVAVRAEMDMSQKAFAEALGFTPQYLCDLEKGRRLGSVEFVNRLCDWMGRGPEGRKEWHMAGARSHGWEI
jgi:transcriptional regulator with XRE-family HTH domain